MKKHLYKYWHWYMFAFIIAIFLIILFFSIYLEAFKQSKALLEMGYDFTYNQADYNEDVTEYILCLLTFSIFPGTIFLAVYFGIKSRRLSKIADAGSMEAFEERERNRKLEKLRRKQSKLDAERKKLEE